MKNVYLIMKSNIFNGVEVIASQKVYTSEDFAQKVANDLDNNAFDSNTFNYYVVELEVDDFQTATDLEEE